MHLITQFVSQEFDFNKIKKKFVIYSQNFSHMSFIPLNQINLLTSTIYNINSPNCTNPFKNSLNVTRFIYKPRVTRARCKPTSTPLTAAKFKQRLPDRLVNIQTYMQPSRELPHRLPCWPL